MNNALFLHGCAALGIGILVKYDCSSCVYSCKRPSQASAHPPVFRNLMECGVLEQAPSPPPNSLRVMYCSKCRPAGC